MNQENVCLSWEILNSNVTFERQLTIISLTLDATKYYDTFLIIF